MQWNKEGPVILKYCHCKSGTYARRHLTTTEARSFSLQLDESTDVCDVLSLAVLFGRISAMTMLRTEQYRYMGEVEVKKYFQSFYTSLQEMNVPYS